MLELPTTFGKYYLTEKLATGGMAEIYLAMAQTDRSDARECAREAHVLLEESLAILGELEETAPAAELAPIRAEVAQLARKCESMLESADSPATTQEAR